MPDEEAVVPILIGRDLLSKMHIHLCQLEIKYSKNDLMRLNELNKNKTLSNGTISALKLLNLFKSPLDMKTEAPTTDVLNDKIRIKEKFCEGNFVPEVESDMVGCINLENDDVWNEIEDIIMLVGAIETDVELNIDKNLCESDVNELKRLIEEKYVDKIGNKRLDSYAMKIKLLDDKPVYSNPRRLSFREKQEVQKPLDELLQGDRIRPSDSPYASPIVLVRKKNGQLRMCVDYRALNKLTVRDRFPLPIIEDCLEYLSNKTYYSTLDLKDGFHQVPMHEESIPLTSFVTPMGQFEYTVMPFGLANAPPVFQRIINRVLKKLIDSGKIVVFLDDIMIATETLLEHMEILAEVLATLSGAGLILNLDKCKFAFREVDYLGYRVNKRGIRPNMAHLKAISDFPVPTNTKETSRCLGLFSYFRRFVADFARIASPLYKNTKKDSVFVWTAECEKAFMYLRKALTEAPVLSIYNPKFETELHTDASSRGFGAAILQRQGDGKFHPVAYFPKRPTPEESKYHSYELETLAIVYALERFKNFLDGLHFTIVTDCNSLVLTLNKKKINPRIARWALEFENFDYEVRHRKGDQMAHVDAMSRAALVCAVCIKDGSTRWSVSEGKVIETLKNKCLSAIVCAIETEARPTTKLKDICPEALVCVVDGSDVDLNIQISQSRDKVINEIKENLENRDIPGYALENGLVFRVNDKNKRQLYVPFEWEDNVMRLIHENYGHVGIEKSMMQIQKHYWFPKMREKLNKFIRNCLKCIYYQPSSRSNERNLHSNEKTPEPFHTVHIDHFGPLPALKSKRKHVLAVVDSFTKFVKLYPVNGTSTKENWCALQKYFEAYSRPKRIIDDRGTCFTSSEFENNMKKYNIVQVKNSVASPQSNGQVEGVNRVIKSMLAKLTDPIDHGDWVKRLSDVEFAINNTVHCTTRQTPSKLLFGVEQRGVIVDELTEHLRENYDNQYESLSEIRGRASKEIQRSQSYNQKYFAEHHKNAKEFEVGDLVMIKHVDTAAGTNKKFNIKYRGPYCVRKCIGNDRYQVTDVENCQLLQMPYNNIVDSSRMRLWLEDLQGSNNTDIEGNTEENIDNKITDDFYTDYEYLDDEE